MTVMYEGPKGAVIVTRVSGKHSAKQGTSLATQLKTARIKAAEMGCKIVAEYEDGGVSGAFLKLRDGMMSAISDIREGRADVLITYSIDRYSRDEEHQHRIKREVESAGGRLVFCNQDFDQTPEGDFTFTILGGQAAYERKRIRKRCMDGRRSRAEGGYQPCRTRRPYGYIIPTRNDVMLGGYTVEQLGKYVVLDDQAKVVRRIYQEYINGGSLQDVCRSLNSDQIATPLAAKYWSPTTVRSILSNPVYKGVAVYGKTISRQDENQLDRICARTGRHYKSVLVKRVASTDNWVRIPAPAIVSEEDWDKVQSLLQHNKKRGGNPDRVRMLSSVMRCGDCRGKMTVSGLKGAYSCQSHTRALKAGVPSPCSNAHYMTASIEGRLLTWMLNASTDHGWLPSAIAEFKRYSETSRSPEVSSVDIAEVEAALLELERKEKSTVQAQIAGVMAGAPPSAYDSVFSDLAQKRKQLEARLKSYKSTVDKAQLIAGWLPISDARDAMRLAHEVLSSSEVSGPEKRDLLLRLVEWIEPSRDQIKVCFLPGIFHETENVVLVM